MTHQITFLNSAPLPYLLIGIQNGSRKAIEIALAEVDPKR
jgi:hypothetical protein